jgi:hypothetical protein
MSDEPDAGRSSEFPQAEGAIALADMEPEAERYRANRLTELEAVIERGRETFVQVGRALAEIRDARLYRANYPSFDAYCRDRWGWSGRHVRRQIEATRIVTALGPIGPTPASEGVARELVPLRHNLDAVRKAWSDVTDRFGSEPTAVQVRSVVRQPKRPNGPNEKRERVVLNIGVCTELLEQLADAPLPEDETCLRWAETLDTALPALMRFKEQLARPRCPV